MPKIFKNLNNSGLSFIPLILLVVIVGLFGLAGYFFNNKDNLVLQSLTSISKASLGVGINNTNSPNIFTYNFDINNTANLQQIRTELKKEVQYLNIELEYFCENKFCITKRTVRPTNIKDTNRGISFEVAVSDPSLLMMIGGFSLKTVTFDVKNLNNPKFNILSNGTLVKKESNLLVKRFSSTSDYIAFEVTGEGKSFFKFLYSINEGVNISQCKNLGKECLVILKKIEMVSYNKNSNTYINDLRFRVPVQGVVKNISFKLDNQLVPEIRWFMTSDKGWRLQTDKRTLENIEYLLSIPDIQVTALPNNLFKFEVIGYGEDFNNLTSSMRSNMKYTTTSSTFQNTIKPSYLGCFSMKCTFQLMLPSNVKTISLNLSSRYNFSKIPSGWKLLNTGNGITR